MHTEQYWTTIDDYRLSSENESLKTELACLTEKVKDLEIRLFKLGAMQNAPCFKCGYNGPGYFQPNMHECAKLHHKYYE